MIDNRNNHNNKILLVDDEEVVIEAIKKHLKKDNYEVLIANNGRDGLALCRQESPQLIMLDLKMPVMTGIEFLEQLELSTSDPYSVIVLTGHGDDDDMEKCFELGASGFLKKPFNAYELRGLVKHFIALKLTQHALKIEIEKQKILQEELKDSKLSFHNIVQKSTDGIIVTNQKGSICFANPVAEALLGRRLGEILGETLGIPIVSGETVEIDIKNQQNSPGVAEMRVAETEWEGSTAYLALLRDITKHKQMEQDLKQSADKLNNVLTGTIQAIAKTTEMRDPYTAGHQERVAVLSCAIAEELLLSENEINGIRVASTLHDIGKIYLPSEILTKPRRLTNIEYSMIKTHSQVGFDILKNIEFPWPIAQIVHQHHERIDGSGYPQGLMEEEILKEAKILCVADVVEAMASHRPYRPSLGIDTALKEITEKRALLYDSGVVDSCIRLFREKDFKFE